MTRQLSSSLVMSSLPPRMAKKDDLAQPMWDSSPSAVPAFAVSNIASRRLPSSERTFDPRSVLACEFGTDSSKLSGKGFEGHW